VAVTLKTRTRVLTEFKLTTARPTVAATDANQNQWVAVGRTVAWDYTGATLNSNSASIPTAPYIAPLYVWDQTHSYGDYEDQNTLTASMQGSVGHGTARFSMDDGAAGAGSHPGTSVDGGTSLECAPFEGDGATISNLARGGWVPGSKTGEPTISGGAGTITGTAAAGAQPWPYPGWYDDSATAWKSAKDSGWNTDVPMWRLGLPHVMHMMRRQLATLVSSKGETPWWAFPTGGGLKELAAECASIRAYVDSEIAKLNFVEDKTGGSGASVLASGRLEHRENSDPDFFGSGIEVVSITRTHPDDTLSSSGRDSRGATAIVCKCTNASATGHAVGSVQIQSEAYGTITSQTDRHPTYQSTGDASKPQGLTYRLPQCWITLGDLSKANALTHFTIWVTASQLKTVTESTDVVDITVEVEHEILPSTVLALTSDASRHPVAVYSVSRQAVTHGGTAPLPSQGTSNFTLGVNFTRGWYSYQDDHSFQIVVHGLPVSISTKSTQTGTLITGPWWRL
jgi:hypothetical protein